MPAIYQGDKKIVDRYVGDKLITRAYQGDKLIFDAYSELSGTLPLTVRSRASQVLKNYIIYGTESGASVETENLFDYKYYFETAVPYTPGGSYFSYIELQLKPNTSYTIFCNLESFTTDNTASLIVCPIEIALTTVNGGVYYENPRTITTQESGKINIALRIRWGSGSASRTIYTESDFENMVAFINLIEGTTAPSSYIPHGYKLPLTVRTGNLWNDDAVVLKTWITDTGTIETNNRFGFCMANRIPVSEGEKVTFMAYGAGFRSMSFAVYDENDTFIRRDYYRSLAQSTYTYQNGDKYIVVYVASLSDITASVLAELKPLIIKNSTPPDHYIPYYNTETPIYIGDSQLMEGEYVDYEEQKIYKLVAGVLTSTDPPVPLPDISLPEGEVTVDTEEEFKYHSTIKGRINPVHYAYSINADTAEITYLADNKNFTPAAMGSTTFDYGSWENAFFMPRPCMLKSNGKVDYYLDPNDYSKKLDGTASDIADPTYDGNAMLEFPKIYYKFVPTGDDGEGGTFHCSNVKLDDSYECWCNYDANNNEIDHFYVAAYNAVILDNKMRSLSGYALTQENGADTTTGATEIAAARANNQNGIDEWYTYLISDHQLLTHLATLMCKHVNHQAKFGRGLDSGSTAAKRAYVTGALNDKGLFWGDTSTGTQGVKIFGIENFYACVWKRAAGLIGTSTGYSYKLTHGTKDGSTATSFNTNGSGYKTIARTKPASNWVTTMHYESNGFWIPATTGTNRFNDYYYNGNGYALVGGSSGNGSYCGSWAVHLAGGVGGSDWRISSALSCKPRALASGT